MIYKAMTTAGFRLTRHDGDFGIEIETETKQEYMYPKSRFWKVDRDGSLRNFGVEYILKSPLSLEQCKDALEEFKDMTSALKFLVSPYTSVHVHCNMMNETFKGMANFITTYILFENALLRYSGPERESNLFCLSFRDAEGCLDNAHTVLAAINSKTLKRTSISEDAAKYSALNFATFSRIGSLEIRTFRGTHDISEIQKWLQIIQKIREFSRIPDMDPVRIVDLAYRDPIEFYNVVFGDLASELNYPDKGELLSNNLWYASKIAKISKDWNTFGVPKAKPETAEVAKGRIDNVSLEMFGVPFDRLDAAFKQILVLEQVQIMYGDQPILNDGGDR